MYGCVVYFAAYDQVQVYSVHVRQSSVQRESRQRENSRLVNHTRFTCIYSSTCAVYATAVNTHALFLSCGKLVVAFIERKSHGIEMVTKKLGKIIVG